MLKAWRRVAVAALAAGAAIAAQFTVIAPAQAAAPTITIFANSKFRVVTNDVFVVYKAGAYSSASIHGKITGAAAGDVAILYAQQFPYKTRPVPLASKTLTAGTQVYSFTVTPSLVTHYAVRLFPSKSRALLATSRVQNVYVASNENFAYSFNCPRPVCHETIRINEFVPSSARATEMGKHVYPYFAVTTSPTRTPPPPKVIFLNAGHPVVSRLRGVNAGEFTFSVTWTFNIGQLFAYPWPYECQRDSVTKDGLGLPGSHGCGASRLAVSQYYVG